MAVRRMSKECVDSIHWQSLVQNYVKQDNKILVRPLDMKSLWSVTENWSAFFAYTEPESKCLKREQIYGFGTSSQSVLAKLISPSFHLISFLWYNSLHKSFLFIDNTAPYVSLSSYWMIINWVSVFVHWFSHNLVLSSRQTIVLFSHHCHHTSTQYTNELCN